MSILMAILILISSSSYTSVNASRVRCESAKLYEHTDTESVFETSDGHLWGVYGTFNDANGYIMIFDSMGTVDVTDDSVLGVIPCEK